MSIRTLLTKRLGISHPTLLALPDLRQEQARRDITHLLKPDERVKMKKLTDKQMVKREKFRDFGRGEILFYLM